MRKFEMHKWGISCVDWNLWCLYHELQTLILFLFLLKCFCLIPTSSWQWSQTFFIPRMMSWSTMFFWLFWCCFNNCANNGDIEGGKRKDVWYCFGEVYLIRVEWYKGCLMVIVWCNMDDASCFNIKFCNFVKLSNYFKRVT